MRGRKSGFVEKKRRRSGQGAARRLAAKAEGRRKCRRRSRAHAAPSEPARKSRPRFAIDPLWAGKLAHWRSVADAPIYRRMLRVLEIHLREEDLHRERLDFWEDKLIAALVADEERAAGDPRASWRRTLQRPSNHYHLWRNGVRRSHELAWSGAVLEGQRRRYRQTRRRKALDHAEN
jgi:hypothetical protein